MACLIFKCYKILCLIDKLLSLATPDPTILTKKGPTLSLSIFQLFLGLQSRAPRDYKLLVHGLWASIIWAVPHVPADAIVDNF